MPWNVFKWSKWIIFICIISLFSNIWNILWKKWMARDWEWMAFKKFLAALRQIGLFAHINDVYQRWGWYWQHYTHSCPIPFINGFQRTLRSVCSGTVPLALWPPRKSENKCLKLLFEFSKLDDGLQADQSLPSWENSFCDLHLDFIGHK